MRPSTTLPLALRSSGATANEYRSTAGRTYLPGVTERSHDRYETRIDLPAVTDGLGPATEARPADAPQVERDDHHVLDTLALSAEGSRRLAHRSKRRRGVRLAAVALACAAAVLLFMLGLP